MGLVTNDIIQVIDVQDYLGQELLNVYYYKYQPLTPSTSDAYDALLDWFEANVIDSLRDLQVTALTHTALKLKNLSNGLDILDRSISIAGTTASPADELEPSFVAYGFILRRESTLTRNGYKRFGGIPEGGVSGNTYVPNPVPIAALETALASDVVVGLVTIFEPVIVRKPVPPATAPTIYSGIGSAQIVRVTTQNSRKP